LLPLQQQPSLQRPSQPLCRLSSLRWLSPLQLPMLRPLLLQLPQCLQQQRLREWLHWLLSQLRLRRWQPMWRLQLWSSLWLPLPELQLALSQLLSVALA
jgi:hypothetical protein